MLAALRVAELLLFLAGLFFAVRALIRFHRAHGGLEMLWQAMFRYHTPDSIWRDRDAWRMVACMIGSLASAIAADMFG